ncbi:hypothetical protein FZ934_24855 (plasmid) [Rhizobium grahamii]|uniref:Integrase n=1 Tax=Rhizobium grahamii TaxID=1120045 RepID=A0A5Q0CDP6_9HYPH|nr:MULTISPECIES: hypothetical protein [Rhizobium]QFY63483.1 hypothetical protein FZ934_24855 [Rhizobium grahamii]QRM51753.1 hypothetical protein F3Y33_20790 [Rhizobium sp. BG6]
MSYGDKAATETRTRDGYLYDPEQDHWYIIDPWSKHHFDFETVPVPPALKGKFKQFVTTCLRLKPVITAHSYYRFTRAFLHRVWESDPTATQITDAHVLNDRASRALSPFVILKVSAALRYWSKIELPGLTRAAALLLATPTGLSPNQNLFVARLFDPLKGAFSTLEFDGLTSTLHREFAAGNVDLDSYAISLLQMVLGLRPTQTASFLVKDLSVEEADGGKVYRLNVPRAKQPGDIIDTPLLSGDWFLSSGLSLKPKCAL